MGFSMIDQNFVKIFRTLFLMTAFIFLSACINVSYRGYIYPKTSYVKLFFDKENFPEDKYDAIGKVHVTAPQGYSSAEINKKILKKARSVGANAVLISSYKKELIGREAGPDSTDMSESEPPGLAGGLPSADDGEPEYENSFGNVEASSGRAQYEYDTIVKAYFYRLKAKKPAPAPTDDNNKTDDNSDRKEKNKE